MTGEQVALSPVGFVGQTLHFVLPIFLNCILYTDSVAATKLMHQIRFLMRLRHGGAYSAPPDLAGFQWPTS